MHTTKTLKSTGKNKRHTVQKKKRHGRRLDLVTITTEHQPSEDANELNDPDPLRRKTKKKKKIVFVGARIHPGETPASYVCQGMMNFLVSDSPIARILRENLIFKFVPMLNPDGVYVGNYRTCILGQDLNRCWQETSTHAYPTLAAIKEVTGALTSEKVKLS
ncbi:hypothetical protein JTE90_011827 [Oedothorax gibbosus]|uniref:Peptidase M14 domain-containing protein n=1 Tax=Oedothorax gibbosus TaxID=931172 RepID=A0AAV6VUB9_9ARAC|nr:hypothetical protein JTE90_011827 [Oedothorax gibbosus]